MKKWEITISLYVSGRMLDHTARIEGSTEVLAVEKIMGDWVEILRGDSEVLRWGRLCVRVEEVQGMVIKEVREISDTDQVRD